MQPSQAASRAGSLQGIDFEALEVRWKAVGNPQSPSPKEQLNILGHATETINSAIADGICDEAEGKRRTAEWLAAHGVERSIRSLERDLVRFRKTGLLSDGRAEANKMKRAPAPARVMRAGWIFGGGGVRFGGGTSKAHKTTTSAGGPVVSRASGVFLLGRQTLGGGMEDL
jgi:hypothetical protein